MISYKMGGQHNANAATPGKQYTIKIIFLMQINTNASRFKQKDITDYMQPSGLQKPGGFNSIFNTANQLGLLEGVNQDQICLFLDKSDLENPSAFRQAIMRKLIRNLNRYLCDLLPGTCKGGRLFTLKILKPYPGIRTRS